MHTFSKSLLVLATFPLLSSACSDSGDNGGDGTSPPADTDATSGDSIEDGVNDTGVDTGPETVVFDTAPLDTGTPETVGPDTDFGEPCLGNTDCDSGWCVEGVEGYICTEECLEECPLGYDCRSVQNAKGDVVFLCLPRVLKLCVSCLEDFQCNGGACLLIDGSRQCASGCDEEADCPSGYTCAADAANEREGTYCQPVSGTCDCSPPFAGITQLCTNDNELGSCLGTETCDPTVGWVDCTAPEPVTESCNFIDDDCDGDVDEDYKVEGVYATREGCGSCSTSCDEVLANAAETQCVVTDGTPRCQVVTCDPGYTQLNPFVCAPESSSLCQPCITAAECLGLQAACTTLDDGDFCTLPCDDTEDCAVGFVCDETENGMQCVPESGSCTCDGSNTNLARSCTKIFTPPDPEQPVVTCKGFEQCTVDGWGGCDLPEDACDGIDNDCDGVIDGPHKTGDKYTAIEHCGACGISCLALQRPNAAPVCDATQVVPVCTYACTGNAVDVNGLTDDGCECVPVPGDDLAGDDLDSNCDGVDGEVDNAIFVSKDGDDLNPGTIDLPVLTLQVGLSRAKANNKRDVYVATGVYSQNIVLEDGVGIFGGYSPEFDRHDVLLYETAIIGGTPDAEHLGTVTAVDVGAPGSVRETVIDGFTIFGVNAGNISGGNSYAIYVRNSGERLRISKNRVFGGPGGNGDNGLRGNDGQSGVDGAPGLAAKNLSSDCAANDVSGGGVGGQLICEDVDAVSGGNGGRANCPEFESTHGDAGANGLGTNSGLGGTFGWPFFLCAVPDPDANTPGCDPYPFACTTCYLPQNNKAFNASAGQDGTTGTNGAAGSAGAATGSTASGEWVGSAGGNGGAGTHGSGGGGGGAGGGVQVDGTTCTAQGDDDVSGSGGGGGSGGCRATGGTGGKAGGGSFGIFIVGASALHTPTLSGNTVQSGRGGAGGNGGAGGVGGAAGIGGVGGTAGDKLPTSTEKEQTRCAAGGGNGGNGGSGGHGGGGGGGAGGPSYGLFVNIPGTPPASWKSGNAFVAGGQGGGGGQGGASVDQTRSGANGADGTAANANF